MTQQELDALAQILSRAPVSIAEALWLNVLLARLAAEVAGADGGGVNPPSPESP